MEAKPCDDSTPQPHKIYLKSSSIETPCPQVLGYTLGKTLGSGTFGKVKAAWSPFERKMIAIKIVKKYKMKKEVIDKFLPREVEILQKVTHPNIIKTFQIVETERHCFFVQEIAQNGDLQDYLQYKTNVPEEETRFIFNQMCQAIAYMHSKNISHRDIKLHNVLLTKDMDIKIADFGFAQENCFNLCSTHCVTYSYGAPEITFFHDPIYNPQLADSWSMGVVLYILVIGVLPFGNSDHVRKGLSNYYNLPLEGNYSEAFKNLVTSLLKVDSTVRATVASIITHPWMTAIPSVRLSWNGPCGGKHTFQNSLPKDLHQLEKLDSHSPKNYAVPYPYCLPESQPKSMGYKTSEIAVTANSNKVKNHLPTSPSHCAGGSANIANDISINAKSPLAMPKSAAKIANATSNDITKHSSVATVTSNDITNYSSVATVTSNDITNHSSVATVTSNDITKHSSVANVTSNDITKHSSVANATSNDITKHSSVANATSNDITKHSGIANATSNDITKHSGVANVTSNDITKHSGVANVTSNDITKHSSVATVASNDITNHSSVANVTSNDITKHSSVATVASNDITNHSGVANGTSNDITKHSGVANVTSNDITKHSGVANVTSNDITKHSSVATVASNDITNHSSVANGTCNDITKHSGVANVTSNSIAEKSSIHAPSASSGNPMNSPVSQNDVTTEASSKSPPKKKSRKRSQLKAKCQIISKTIVTSFKKITKWATCSHGIKC